MNLNFAELHAAALLSQDPAAYLARHGLRDVVGECLRWIEAADVAAVLAGASECNLAAATPAQTLLGECFDALRLWDEHVDGIDFEPVEEAARRRVWVAGFRPQWCAVSTGREA